MFNLEAKDPSLTLVVEQENEKLDGCFGCCLDGDDGARLGGIISSAV